MGDNVEQIVHVLLAAGWLEDGQTASDTVRIPTQRSPVFGGSGGELRTIGGRRRFRNGERFCTVGPRTVNFYRRGKNGPEQMEQVNSRDIAGVADKAK